MGAYWSMITVGSGREAIHRCGNTWKQKTPTRSGDRRRKAVRGKALQRDTEPHQAERHFRSLQKARLLVLLAHRGSETIPSAMPEEGDAERTRGSDAGRERARQGEKFMSLGATDVSDDSNLLAYTSDNVGFRQYKLHIKICAPACCYRTLRTVSIPLPGRRQ